LREAVAADLAPRVTRIDYVTVADSKRLATIDDRAELGATALLAIAVWIGKTRLIDNVVLGEDPSPIGNPP
jgi:pantoate--beta-alanine ligase